MPYRRRVIWSRTHGVNYLLNAYIITIAYSRDVI